MHDAIKAVLLSSASPLTRQRSNWENSSAPFWWLLVHLEMLILAPIKIDGLSCRQTILERIHRFRQGQIEELFQHAMQATSWASPEDRPPRDENRAV